MNDTELDDMLNQWEAPQVPARLRDSIKPPPPERKWRLSWPSWHLSKGLLAGALAGAAMCFIGITAAFPQVVGPTPRFTLISEVINYHDDGSSVVNEYRSSTARNGAELILHRGYPNNAMLDLHMRFFDAVHRLFGITTDPTRPPVSMALSDCSIPAFSVIGHETILGYKAIVQREVDQDEFRYTEWRSRDLDCIVMKFTKEQMVNGKLRLTEERRPTQVTMNRAQ